MRNNGPPVFTTFPSCLAFPFVCLCVWCLSDIWENNQQKTYRIMAEWDLTPVLSQYLDPHFVYGLLEFLGSQDVCIDIVENVVDLLIHIFH